jgi:hypothetical protein
MEAIRSRKLGSLLSRQLLFWLSERNWSRLWALWDPGSSRLNCIRISGALLRNCGTTAISARPSRRPRRHSKVSCKELLGPAVSGENLASLFSTNDPTPGSPRLRLRNVDPESKTWKSAHEGAAALIRGAFMGVRNLVSHPGWPDPSSREAIEMLAVLSYVANLVEQSDVAEAS